MNEGHGKCKRLHERHGICQSAELAELPMLLPLQNHHPCHARTSLMHPVRCTLFGAATHQKQVAGQ